MKNYGVLKGKAKQLERDSDSDPHSELLMEANGTKYRVAINVRSSRGPTEQRLVEYLIIDNLRSALVDAARALPLGFTDLRDGATHSAAIDYIRSNLFRAASTKMTAPSCSTGRSPWVRRARFACVVRAHSSRTRAGPSRCWTRAD